MGAATMALGLAWSGLGSALAEVPRSAPSPNGLAGADRSEEAFVTPPELRSKDGQLFVTMEARPTQVHLGGREISGATYNGVYAGPVLRLKPGDTLHFHLINHLPQATNVHFHGLAVSPQGHGDNSMHMVAAGESWDYVIAIPKDHPPGVYWYHTHGHDFAERGKRVGNERSAASARFGCARYWSDRSLSHRQAELRNLPLWTQAQTCGTLTREQAAAAYGART